MSRSIKEFISVGIVHFMAYPNDQEQEATIKKILCDDYFDAIEITKIQTNQTKLDLLCSHAKIGYGAQPVLLKQKLNLNSLNEGDRIEAVNAMKICIDEAYELGAGGIGFLSGRYEESTKEIAYQQLLKSISVLCQYAKQQGNLNLLLEVFDFDIDKCALVGPVSMAKRIATEVTNNYDNFGLMVDLSHIPMLYETIEESLYPVSQFIKHAHIGNTVIKKGLEGYGDLHPRFGFANSENDVQQVYQFLKALFHIGYLKEGQRPIVSFEVKPMPGEDPDIVVGNAKRVLNEAWSILQRETK